MEAFLRLCEGKSGVCVQDLYREKRASMDLSFSRQLLARRLQQKLARLL